MVLIKKTLLALLFCCASLSAISQLQITGSVDANALAQKLVGGGVTISNATISGHGFSSAFFINQGGTQLSVDSGIVLSTGRVQTSSLPGLNGSAFNHASSSFAFPGDAQLNALVAPLQTNDAVFLEFDFVPMGDTVKFNYIFSSEEYPQYTCTIYNDVFAFFISGPGITGTKNLALVPGTNIPVTINSINDGIHPDTDGLCAGMGPGSPFSQYFINNVSSQYFTHDGHTVVLTAMSPVTPCQTYHLKIAIADVSDDALDSGVFLEAGSLKSDPIEIMDTLPVMNGIPYLVEGCQTGNIQVVRSKKSVNPLTINLVFGGNAINGTDYQTIPASVVIPANDSVVTIPIAPIPDNIAEGTDSLKIFISSGCQVSGLNYLDSIVIHIRDYDTLGIAPVDTIVCKGATTQLTATGNTTNIQWTPVTGLNDPTISNPVATTLVSTTYIATSGTGTCQAMDSAVVRVKNLQLVSKTDINCKNGSTGEIKVTGGGIWTAPVQYNINNNGFVADSTFTNLPVGSYTVRIKDATNCIDSIQVNLVQAYPDLLVTDSIVTASCNGLNGQVFLTPAGGLAPYTFNTDNTPYVNSNSFTVNGGNHTVYVKDANNCVYSKPVVVQNDPPINFTATPSPALCTGVPAGYIYINANGGTGQYEYSGDGTTFGTADSVLINTTAVTITVRDDKGCSASTSITVPLNQPVFVDLGPDVSICEGKNTQFNPSFNANSFSWTANTTLSSTSISNPVATPVTTTTYYITATKEFCIAKDTITVNVMPAPVPLAGPDSTICSGRTINLNAGGGVDYIWTSSPSGTLPNEASPSIKPAHTTSYYLEVVDANGCTSLKKDTVKITVTPPIQAFAGNDTMVTIGQPLQLTGSDFSAVNSPIYQWTPSLGLNDANIANPIATLNADITYLLTITTAEGCEGKDLVNVKVYMGPEIYVPSGFTPDNNGRNDQLRAITVGIKKLNYFRVFNRWGQMIYSTSSDRLGWDGKINGVDQPTGTYVWLAEGIDYKGNLIFRKGVSTLVR